MIALQVADTLRANGKIVTLARMEKSVPGQADLEDSALGLVFPVACWSSYPTVTHFVENLPEGRGREAFMLATHERFTGGVEGPMKKILLAKGYRPLGSAFFKMPGNFPAVSSPEEERVLAAEEALLEATRFTAALTEGRTVWGGGIPLLSSLLYRLGKTSRPWNAIKKRFPISLNKTACIRCGRCFRLCPRKAIAIPDYPLIDIAACETCRRCVRFCPTHALTIPKKQAKPCKNFGYDDFMKAFR